VCVVFVFGRNVVLVFSNPAGSLPQGLSFIETRVSVKEEEEEHVVVGTAWCLCTQILLGPLSGQLGLVWLAAGSLTQQTAGPSTVPTFCFDRFE
jgi:hypothetical protein